MGFWDSITGRTKPKQANLDALFGVPSAALTLQASPGFVPTGDGAVCYRAAAGAGFADAQQDLVALIGQGEGAPRVSTQTDTFGFTWLLVDHDPIDPAHPDLTGLCTDLHAVNTTLEMDGFGPGLLCSLIPFQDSAGRKVALVYLYKQGTFYPFAPSGTDQRDNLLEIQIRDTLKNELPLEGDLGRWMALWGAPGL
ncbi:MAG: PspA-associated protein PspAB [Nocardioides sp.]